MNVLRQLSLNSSIHLMKTDQPYISNGADRNFYKNQGEKMMPSYVTGTKVRSEYSSVNTSLENFAEKNFSHSPQSYITASSIPKLNTELICPRTPQAVGSPNFTHNSGSEFKNKLSNLKTALDSIKKNLQQIKPLKSNLDFKIINAPFQHKENQPTDRSFKQQNFTFQNAPRSYETLPLQNVSSQKIMKGCASYLTLDNKQQ